MRTRELTREELTEVKFQMLCQEHEDNGWEEPTAEEFDAVDDLYTDKDAAEWFDGIIGYTEDDWFAK